MLALLKVLEANWLFVLKALGTTVAVSLSTMLIGLVLGTLVAVGRTYGGRVADLVLGFYVDSMRAIPVLVILVWSYFALPLLTGDSLSPFTAAIGALGAHLAAYVAETVRAGLTSVRAGQMRAALALGMSRGQAVRTIILPQAMVRMLPSLGSLLVIAIKDSSISSVIAVPELIRQTQILVGNTYLSFQLYTFTMVVFFLISYPVVLAVESLYRRVAHLGGVMTFDWSVIWDARDQFLAGAGMTVMLAVATMALAIPGGLLLAFLRLVPLRPVQWCAWAFVEFFRATPLVLQIYWAYYVLPVLVDIRLPAVTTALVGLTCNVSAFNSETFRAGILSIRPGQVNAGLALGMDGIQVMRRIVLPQAVMRVLPSLASTWVSLFKDTSLVSVIAVPELSYVALKVRADTYRILEVLTAMAVLYWLMGYPQAKLVDWIHRRFKVAE